VSVSNFHNFIPFSDDEMMRRTMVQGKPTMASNFGGDSAYSLLVITIATETIKLYRL